MKRVYYPDYLNLMKFRRFLFEAVAIKDEKGKIIAYDIRRSHGQEISID